MSQFISRPTWITIDKQKFQENMMKIQQKSRYKEIWAVVKSNAYGHDIDLMFPLFLKQKITNFCVAQLDEAIELQKIADTYQIAINILIFGDIDWQYFSLLKSNWRITVASQSWYAAYCMQNIDLDFPVKVHIKVDSGMNRRGIKNAEGFERAFTDIAQDHRLDLEGIYTHFATSDSNHYYMEQQYHTFVQLTKEYLHRVRYVHAQNSHGILNLSKEQAAIFNLVRPGGICYGLSGTIHKDFQPILGLYSRVSDSKIVKKGESIGYNNGYYAEADGWVGVVPIGYSDGWMRSNKGIKIQNSDIEVAIVGNICMDQLMLYSEKKHPILQNDLVELIGQNVSIFKVAAYNETIDYEITCSLSSRIPRQYK